MIKWKPLNHQVDKPTSEPIETEAYAILELKSEASADEIKINYRRLMQRYHPDRAPIFLQTTYAEITKKLNAAYAHLTKQKDE